MKQTKQTIWRVVGRMGGGLGYILGFRTKKDIQEWIDKGWNKSEIEFIKCTNKEN